MGTVLITNPFIDINVPGDGIDEEKLKRVAELGGVATVIGSDRQSNGKFLSVRVYFNDKAAMDAYLGAFKL